MNLTLRRIFAVLKRTPLWLIVLLLITVAIWGFVKLAGEIVEGDTQAFDEWAVQALRQPGNPEAPLGPAWLAESARDATGLGSFFFLGLLAVAVAGYLSIIHKHRTALLLVATTVAGVLASLLLKSFFSRPRPSVVPHLTQVFTSSFPSGHSMMSAVVYLTLASIVAATVKQRSLKIYVFAVAFFMSGLVGLSRVYLGVHYPSDVLGGWTAGIICALLSWSLTIWLQREGAVEPPTETED